MLLEALKKLQAEINANTKTKWLDSIGSYMIDRVRQHPENAENVMANGKTLKGALKAMSELAMKDASDGCGVLTDEEGFAVVLKYYGIAVPKAADPVSVRKELSVSVDDLF